MAYDIVFTTRHAARDQPSVLTAMRLKFVPRIGECVMFGTEEYRVKDVGYCLEPLNLAQTNKLTQVTVYMERVA